MGRPRKNRDNLVGRAGRQAIEQEDLQRESQKWMRRKETLARLRDKSIEAANRRE
jgi:hypothetical protein